VTPKPERESLGGKAIRYWEYFLPEGWRALAGRTDGDNDRLTFKLARPDDWWFHVRGMPGSHVVLTREEGGEPGRDIVRAAASIAAWHSKARNGGVVPVVATLARNLRKPRGARAGTVEVRQEKVLKVRPGLPDAEIKGLDIG